jgi:hypothetical protein
MIFGNVPRLGSSQGISKYVHSDLYVWFKNVITGLNGRLNFDENFNSFLSKDIEILTGATAIISNELDVIPTERYIVKQVGDGVITDGEWDLNSIKLINNGSGTVTISVRFFFIFDKDKVV